MGCDIHLAVEVRRDGTWERALPPEHARDPYYVQQASSSDADGWYSTRARVEWFTDRHYDLFGILANVRNYNDLTPISEPRGFPEDMSDELKSRIDPEGEDDNDMWLGDHSFSWLTLAELQAHPWGDMKSDLLTRVMPALAELGAPDDVRIVFGFDN